MDFHLHGFLKIKDKLNLQFFPCLLKMSLVKPISIEITDIPISNSKKTGRQIGKCN